MHTDLLISITSWATYLSAIAAMLTFITGILFFTIGDAFGKINDIASIFQVIFMIPVSIGIYWLLPSSMRTLDLIAVLIGTTGMIFATYGQSLLVLGKIDFEGSMRFFPAGAAIGVWLVLTSAYTLENHQFPVGFTWIGILAGAGYIATVVAFLIKGQQSIFFYMSGLVLGISYPIWAIWLGYIFGSGVSLLGIG